MNHVELKFNISVDADCSVSPAKKYFLKNGLQFHLCNIIASDLGVSINDVHVDVEKVIVE